MGKLLLWVVIILVAMVAIRIISARHGAKPHAPKPAPRAPARQPGSGPTESMVNCAHCGIYLPRSEAIQIGGKVWCSHEHARLGER